MGLVGLWASCRDGETEGDHLSCKEAKQKICSPFVPPLSVLCGLSGSEPWLLPTPLLGTDPAGASVAGFVSCSDSDQSMVITLLITCVPADGALQLPSAHGCAEAAQLQISSY